MPTRFPLVLALLLLATSAGAAPPTLEDLRGAREQLDEALREGPDAAAEVLQMQVGVVQSDLLRRLARVEPMPPAAGAAVARAFDWLSTPARHAAVPILAAIGGPREAALVTPHLADLPEYPGFLSLRSRTFEAVVTMWLRGSRQSAGAGLLRLVQDEELPAELRGRAQEAAWSLLQLGSEQVEVRVQDIRAPSDP